MKCNIFICYGPIICRGLIWQISIQKLFNRWAGEPDLADGRVYLYNGDVHLVAPCSGPGDLTPFPVGTPQHGNLAMFLAKYPHLSLAKSEVQKVRTFLLCYFFNLKPTRNFINKAYLTTLVNG